MDKENFLKANCRIFFNNDISQDETLLKLIHFPIDWKKVQRVDLICPYGLMPSCAICLEEEFVAPHITRCGHVFCLTCFFRFMDSNSCQYNKKKCPICSNFVSKEDLRPTRFQLVEPCRDAQRMTFCLVERRVDLALTQLSKFFIMQLQQIFPHINYNSHLLDEESIGIQFTRYATLKRPDIFLEQDIKSLNFYLEEVRYSEDLRGIELVLQAIEFVQEKIRKLRSCYYNLGQCLSLSDLKKQPNSNLVDYDLMDFIQISSTFLKSENDLSLAFEADTYTTSNQTIHNSDKFYTTYQAVDGQLCFLDPFHLRCLKYEYKNSSSIPPVLLDLKVIETQSYLLNEDIRNKHKFLHHLPLLTQVTFVEADIDHLLSEKTKFYFQNTFEYRSSLKTAKKQKSNLREKIYQKQLRIREKTKMNNILVCNHRQVSHSEDIFSFPALREGPVLSPLPSSSDITLSEINPNPESLKSPTSTRDTSNNNPSSPSYLDILTQNNSNL